MVKTKSQIKSIINNYKVILEQNNIRPQKMLLYGSYAVGKPNKWSDIDLVVISKTFGLRNAVERMEFLSQKAAEVDDSLEVLGFTVAELKKEKNSIFSEIISKAKSY